jgi:xylulokinase
MESIRRAAEAATGQFIHRIVAVGGGTRNCDWLSIKADVSGCLITAWPSVEATLLGAALAAGIGCGQYADAEEALTSLTAPEIRVAMPDSERHGQYQALYERGYRPLQESLGPYYAWLAGGSS